MEQQDRQNKKPRIALCTEFGGGQSELEETQHEALVLCWKRTQEDSFLCEWNPATEQFNRRFQVSNKRLNDAMLDIQVSGWYQIRFVKYKNSDLHISIVECKQILYGPFRTRVQDGIVQLNVPVWHAGPKLESVLGEMPVREVPENLNACLDFVAWCQLKYKPVDGHGRNEYELGFVELDEKKNEPEIEQSNVGEIQQQVPLHAEVKENQPAAAKAMQRGNDFGDFDTTNNDTNDRQHPLRHTRRFGQLGNQQQEHSLPNANSVNSIPKEVIKEKQQQQFPINSVQVQPFALSAPDSKRKLPMASSRASTPVRVSNMRESPKTYRQVLDVPKKYRAVLVGSGGNMLAGLQSRYGVKLIVPSKFSDKPVEITGTDGDSVNKCMQAIEAMIRRLQMQTKKVNVPIRNWRLIPLLVGKGGNKINQLRYEFPRVKVDIPSQSDLEVIGDKCVPVITLQGDSDAVDSLRQLLVQQIEELKERNFILYIPIPNVHPDYMKYLRGADCKRIQQLAGRFPEVKMDLPFAADASPMIRLEGPQEKVYEMETTIEAVFEELQKASVIKGAHATVPVEEEYLPLFFRGNARMIQKIQKEHPNCRIFLDRDYKRFHLQGKRAADVDAAKRQIQETIITMNLHDYVPVEEKYFTLFMRADAQVIREIQEDHPNCGIFLERDRKRFHLQGKRADVDAAKQRIQDILAEMNVHDYVPVEEEYLPLFFRANARMIQKIQKEHPNCGIYLEGCNGRFHLEGKRADVDAAKHRIEEILHAMATKITRKVSIPANAQRYLNPHFGKMRDKFSVPALRPCEKRLEVPREYRKQLMAMGGEEIRRLERKYNVDIDVQRPQDGQQYMVQLTVVGPEEMVERCVAFMKADMPVSKLVKVPQEFRDHFLGNGGQLVQQMQKQHGVQIHFASVLDHSDDVAVVGEAAQVNVCIRAILQKVAQFRAEKNLALSRATTSNARAAASLAGSNGIQRSASAATGIQSRGTSSPMMRRVWSRR